MVTPADVGTSLLGAAPNTVASAADRPASVAKPGAQGASG
jgi:hypothetical protein